jgi:hypothetical protein
MIRFLLCFFFIILELLSGAAFAQNEDILAPPPAPPIQCINGASPLKHELMDSFEDNQDPLKMAYLNYKLSQKHPLLALTMAMCGQITLQEQNLSFFARFGEAISLAFTTSPSDLLNPSLDGIYHKPENEKNPATSSSPFEIKKECIEVSMKRRSGNTQYACQFPSKGPHVQNQAVNVGKATADNNQCFNQSMLDYTHFAVNEALDCIAGDTPIDRRSIWKKINTESASNYSVSSDGGQGLMQITSAAKDDMLERGRTLMQNVANSSKKSCAPFKHIAKKDLEKAPKISGDESICDWAGPGDGLARNLLYGIGYTIFMRDNEVVPALEKISPRLAKMKGVVERLTIMTYGREGIRGVKATMAGTGMSGKSNEEHLNAAITKRSAYVAENEAKQKEYLCIINGIDMDSCKKTKFSKDEMAANKCVIQ